LDNKRAIEIISSLGVIEVRHQGSPVWIEQVEDDFAEIKYLDKGKRIRVPVNELAESNPGLK